MTSIHSSSANDATTDYTPTEETLATVFASPRRATILRVLDATNDAVELDELARRVVALEDDGDPGGVPVRDVDRAIGSIYYEHLPVLTAAGLAVVAESDGVWVYPVRPALDGLDL